MNKLNEINAKLYKLNSELISYADSLEFHKICEFNLENCSSLIPWNDLKFSGLYLIEIKNDLKYNNFSTWVENFRDEWEHDNFKRHFVSNLRKIRIDQHSELKKWIPIYIGKSKLIGARIHQHIYKELGKPTFALKLNERENMREKIFRLSIIKVPNENYDWVMPVLEKTLRNKINPIIGKQ